MSNPPLRIGVAGLGTVGIGVIRVLSEQSSMISARCNREVKVVAISAQDPNKKRGLDLSNYIWYSDPLSMATDENIDVVVEVIGGSSGIAKDLVESALNNKKHVITANKALIASAGLDLARSAEHVGKTIGFEAAVAGGVPIVKAIREGLSGSNIQQLFGILNGTCNYILSEMRETGRDFDKVLGEAQDLGYAEADPTFDIDGVDSAHKLAILTSIAFGCEINFDSIQIEGIRHISPLDIQFASDLGYRIKLLGMARKTEAGIQQRVHPCMVPVSAPIAHVEGVYNAVVTEGSFVGRTMYEGRGAGEGPTASAVVADIIDIALSRNTNLFLVPTVKLERMQVAPVSSYIGSYYARFMVTDKTGVFATIANALNDNGVSMESVLQRGRSKNEAVPVVLTTHETDEASLIRALEAIERSKVVFEPPRFVKIESF
ncbi:MAG: homoserine dehydrogenase [Rhodospirillales bacterium]